MSAGATNYPVVLVKAIRQEKPGVKTFTICNEDGTPVPYSSGQFITLVFTHHGREERRSFSISSSYEAGETLSFTVKRLDNGAYSRYLHDKISIGDQLYTSGVAGLFTLPANIQDYSQVFLFAAGIGITPVFSLIKSMLCKQSAGKIVLIYSNQSQEETVFYNDLMELKGKYPERFMVEFLYSGSFDLSRARLNKALMPTLLKEYSVAPLKNTLYYICGPYDYMRMAMWSLEENGIPSAQIKKENFNLSERGIAQSKPPDKQPHKVTVIGGGAEQSFVCQYPDTILQAAKKNNIVLPYSCEVGRCGSCAVLCKSGKVWLSYNEVLMDSDLAHGATLTCTGYPVGGDIIIAI